MRRRPPPETHRPYMLREDARVLVVKLAGLGDMLLATPALRALHQRYPRARIDALVSRESAPMLAASPLLDHVIAVEKYALDYPWQAARQPGRALAVLPWLVGLRRTRYDAVVLLHHLTLPFGRLKYRLLLASIGAPVRAGLDNGRGGFLTIRVPDRGFGVRHEAEYALDVAAALDAPLPLQEHGPRLADLGWRDVPPWVRGPGPGGAADGPVVALHPGGGDYSLARRWPAGQYVALARALHERVGATCVLVGGAEERQLHGTILAALRHPAWLTSQAGATDPHALARLLASCALFIGNDSLPMHLAAAVGVPVVAIFGPSNADAWAPYAPAHRERVRVVRRVDLPCSPCIYRGHALGTPQGCPERPCLTGLPVQPVLVAALRLLPPASAAVAG